MKKIKLVGIALMIITVLGGCTRKSEKEVASATKTEALPTTQECYQNLTKSDKLFYNDLLLNALNAFCGAQRQRVRGPTAAERR